jgi:hypothetical protein
MKFVYGFKYRDILYVGVCVVYMQVFFAGSINVYFSKLLKCLPLFILSTISAMVPYVPCV